MTDPTRISDDQHNNAPAVPQGWKLVPVEPTEAMSIAGGIAWESSLADDVIGPLEDAWAAMLAATPAPAPAVPQGVPGIGSRVVNDACWKFIEAMPHGLPAPIWNDLKPALYEALKFFAEQQAATPAPAPARGEPFGYFRAEPFGWTDCSEDAEGAIALYEHPAAPAQEVGLTEGEIQALGHRIATTYRHDEDGFRRQYAFNIYTLVDFANAIIAALRAKGGK